MTHDIFKIEKVSESYYKEGLKCNRLNIPGAAINAFKKCIEWEEVDCYKACYELSKIYMKLQDYDAAYEYCMQAIRIKPQFIQAMYYMAHILRALKIPLEEFKKRMEAFTHEALLDSSIIADIYYMEGYYEIALEYANAYEAEKESSDAMKLFEVKCLIRSARYEECIQYINRISEENLYYFKTMMYKVFCLILTNDHVSVWKLLNKFKFGRVNSFNKKVLSVYIEFYNVSIGNKNSTLCEDEKDLEYTSCIFEICDILLVNKEFDSFEKALNLFNLVSDKTVLLQLAKLYNKYGYIELAKKEIIRSIKLFEVFDGEGLDIL